jgi:hypothetical protein
MVNWHRMRDRQVFLVACNDAAGTLKFIPELAEKAYDTFVDPNRGACNPDFSKKLINCSRKELWEELTVAYNEAADNDRHLLVYVLGHGDVGESGSFYYLPYGATLKTGIDFCQFFKQQIDGGARPNGTLLIIDTCHSGDALRGIGSSWINSLSFMAVAAVARGRAFGGRFTEELLDVIHQGTDSLTDPFLDCSQAAEVVSERVKDQAVPSIASGFRAGGRVPYLARNPRLARAAEIGAAGQKLPNSFQPGSVLREISTASRTATTVHVRGPLGSGKTTLALALSTRFGIAGFVEPGFADAAAFLTSATTAEGLGQQLHEQLIASSAAFRNAVQEVESAPIIELRQAPQLRRRVLDPCGKIRSAKSLRMVFDGIEELDRNPVSGLTIREFLKDLAGLPGVRLVIFGPNGYPLPGAAPKIIQLHWAAEQDLVDYFARRNIRADLHDNLLRQSERNWAYAARLADLAADNALTPQNILSVFAQSYDDLLSSIARGAVDWQTQLRPILGVVAAAGAAPILPIRVLCHASGLIGGPTALHEVRAILDRLTPILDRRNPNRDEELVGLEKASFAEYLFHGPTNQFSADRRESLKAIVDTTAQLAPLGRARGPVATFAWSKEAEYLNALGQRLRALASLRYRESRFPSEDLSKWQLARDAFAADPGDYSLEYLYACCQIERLHLDILNSMPQKEENAVAAPLESLRKAVRRLGVTCSWCPEYWSALSDRATHISNFGSETRALRIARRVFTFTRGYQPSDLIRLEAEYSLALLGRRTGEVATPRVLELLENLLRLENSIQPGGQLFLNARAFRASLIGETKPEQSLAMLQEVLTKQRELLGDEDADVLSTRYQIIFVRVKIQTPKEIEVAYKQARELVADQIRFYGPSHSETLETRVMALHLASVHQFVQPPEILQCVEELLRDAGTALQPGHYVRFRAAFIKAVNLGRIGQTADSRALFESILGEAEEFKQSQWIEAVQRELGAPPLAQ